MNLLILHACCVCLANQKNLQRHPEVTWTSGCCGCRRKRHCCSPILFKGWVCRDVYTSILGGLRDMLHLEFSNLWHAISYISRTTVAKSEEKYDLNIIIFSWRSIYFGENLRVVISLMTSRPLFINGRITIGD